MDSSDREDQAERIIDVSVPPIPDEPEDDFLNSDGIFSSQKFSEFAYNTSGTAGSIGVALEILRDVKHKLGDCSNKSGFEPEEIEHQRELIETVLDILINTADHHISGYDAPLYDEEDIESALKEDADSKEQEKRKASEQGKYPTDQFAKVDIEKVNSKGNILTFPENLSQDHLHLSHGQKGDEVIIFTGSGSSMYSNRMQFPVLPFESIEEAASNYSRDTPLQLKEGDLLKLSKPNTAQDSSSAILLEGFNVNRIELDESIPERYQITVRIEDIDGSSAEGTREYEYRTKKNRTSRIKTTTVTTESQNKSQRKSGNKHLFGSVVGNKNDLINGNIR